MDVKAVFPPLGKATTAKPFPIRRSRNGRRIVVGQGCEGWIYYQAQESSPDSDQESSARSRGSSDSIVTDQPARDQQVQPQTGV